MADGTEKKVDVSLTLKKQDGKSAITGWSMMH